MQMRKAVRYWWRYRRIISTIQYHIAEVRKIDHLYIANQMGKPNDQKFLADTEMQKERLYRQLFKCLRGIVGG